MSKRISARRAGAAAARQSLRKFDREIAAMDKAAEVAPVVEEVPAELVSRPAEIKTVQFEMGGKTYQTRSSWELLG